MSTPREVRTPRWQIDLGEPVAAVGSSPDSSRWAILGTEGKLLVVSAENGNALGTWTAHSGGGFRLAWHPSLDLVATSGADGTARLWNPSKGEQVRECTGGNAWVEHLEWSPDGGLLATAAGRVLSVWTPEGEPVHAWRDHKSTVAAVCWRADGRRLAAACYGGVGVHDPASGKTLEHLPWKTSLLSLAWSPDGRWVVAGTQDLSVQVWPQPFRAGDELAMSGYTSKVRELVWHHGSRYLATGGGDEVMVWDCGGDGPAGREPRILQGHKSRISALAYQARGHLLASGDTEGHLRLWNAKQPQALQEMSVADGITTLGWARDDRALLTGTHSGRIALVAAPTP